MTKITDIYSLVGSNDFMLHGILPGRSRSTAVIVNPYLAWTHAAVTKEVMGLVQEKIYLWGVYLPLPVVFLKNNSIQACFHCHRKTFWAIEKVLVRWSMKHHFLVSWFPFDISELFAKNKVSLLLELTSLVNFYYVKIVNRSRYTVAPIDDPVEIDKRQAETYLEFVLSI